jgi:NAD(P)-dependent dehydrogenase (short-subunit alcohol dehydrogenase family)
VRLAGKRMLVTGSTMGIGFAAAQMMHREGARVAVHGRDLARVRAAIDQLGGGPELVPIVGDVGDLADCRRMIDEAVAALGGMDCLVNNAGISDLSYPEDVTEYHYRRVANVNLRSAFFLTQYALKELRKSKGAVIFNASVCGLFAGPTDSYIYACVKSGMINLGRSLALELAPDVRVNVLCPGYIDTPLIAAENAATDGQIYTFIESAAALKRIGTMKECASAMVYLASGEATYFTGSILVNDGGLTAKRTWGGRN